MSRGETVRSNGPRVVGALLLLLALPAALQPALVAEGSMPAPATSAASLETGGEWVVQGVTVEGMPIEGQTLAVDGAGTPHIVYTTADRRLIHATLAGDTWVTETVAAAAAGLPVLVLDEGDALHVAYTKPGPPGPSVVYATNEGGGWISDTVDADMAAAPSLVLDADGSPHLAYQDVRPTYVADARGIVYASRIGAEWSSMTVDHGIAGCESDCDPVPIVLDAAGRPGVSYRNTADDTLYHASWNGGAWVKRTVDTDALMPSLAIDGTGALRIAYTKRGPSVKYGVLSGDTWIVETVDPQTSAGPSLALDPFGTPHLAYFDVRPLPVGDGAKYVYRGSAGWEVQEVEWVAGSLAWLALDTAGIPHVSYYDATNDVLKYARWQPAAACETVPDTGGELVSAGDQTSYVFPAGTFTDTVVITHTQAVPGSLPPADGLVGIGHSFDITAVYSDTAEAAQPAAGQSYTITVGYGDDEVGLVDESTLALYYWDGDTWHEEPSSSTSPENNTVTASPDHFSLWTLMGEVHRLRLPVLLRGN